MHNMYVCLPIYYYLFCIYLGAAWCKIRADHHIMAPALLIGAKDNAAKLVSSAHYCLRPTLRMVLKPTPEDSQVAAMILDFLVGKN